MEQNENLQNENLQGETFAGFENLLMPEKEFTAVCKTIVPEEELMVCKKCRRNVAISAICMLLGIALGVLLTQLNIFAGVIVAIVSLIFGIVFMIKKRYKWDNFKGKYGSIAIEKLLPGYVHKYSHDKWIGGWVLRKCGFVDTSFDSCGGEDLLTIDIPNDDGTPSGVQLSICDAWATRTDKYMVTKTDSNGKTYQEEEEVTVTLYDGVIGYVHFPFKFKCNIGINASLPKTKKIPTEDIAFNRTFKFKTDDKLEALCILTPTLMQKLKVFNSRNRKLKITLMKSGAIYFGMKRNLFKLTAKRGGPNGRVFKRFYNDIYDILSLVNEIKINNKVFKM